MVVLVVEDDDSVADGIVDALAGAGNDVARVATGRAALERLREGAIDLVILDLGLPDVDGTDVCRTIRSRSDVPVIVVSARSSEIDRVLALEMGADDYLVKPFGIRELIARIHAVARRGGASSADEPTTVHHGPLTVDRRAQRVWLDARQVHLTPTEFALLAYLSADPGAVHRRADIVRDVWDTEWFGATKTLDAHVAAIRRKLGSPAWIEAVRGVGFRFEVPA